MNPSQAAVTAIRAQVSDWTQTNAQIAATLGSDGTIYLAQPDSTGTYCVSNLPAGDYTLQLSAPGWLPESGRSVTLGTGASVLQSYAPLFRYS